MADDGAESTPVEEPGPGPAENGLGDPRGEEAKDKHQRSLASSVASHRHLIWGVAAGVVGFLVLVGGAVLLLNEPGRSEHAATVEIEIARSPEVPLTDIPREPSSEKQTVVPEAPLPVVEADGGIVVTPYSPSAFAHIPAAALDPPLPAAPDPALVQTTRAGLLPKIAADGRTARQVYARPFNTRDDRLRLVVIVTGFGLNEASSRAILERLPGVVVIAVDAYAQSPQDWARRAREAGHEVLATVPLELAQFPFEDQGPRALLVAATGEANLQQMEGILGRLVGYVGVLATGGSAFGEDIDSLTLAAASLRRRGLLLVDATNGSAAPLFRAPHAGNVTVIPVNVVIDGASDAPAIDRQFAALAGFAQQHFVGVAIAPPEPKVIERLNAWIAGLDANRYVLAPVSAIAEKTSGH
ncbi:MAG: divergent polysaccharide deacetylase family protein [Rhodospirillales bacterium]|nr:divergent polysaccharide deacetylase family protein [Rhodospirillales bacterium]